MKKVKLRLIEGKKHKVLYEVMRIELINETVAEFLLKDWDIEVSGEWVEVFRLDDEQSIFYQSSAIISVTFLKKPVMSSSSPQGDLKPVA